MEHAGQLVSCLLMYGLGVIYAFYCCCQWCFLPLIVCYGLADPLAVFQHEFFVFFNQQFGRAPISFHRRCRAVGEVFVYAFQKFPIGVAPAIDTLFHIAYDEIIIAFTLCFLYEWTEVLPLQCTGILKLINHVVIQLLSHSFVDEWCLLSVNHLVKKRIDLGYWNTPYFFVGFAYLI